MFGAFNACDWFWLVRDNEASGWWSSAAGGYVDALPEGVRAATIANEFELDQVLRQHGMSIGREFTAEETLAALVNIDAGQVRAALGRDKIDSIEAGDADKLRDLADQLQPAAPGGIRPPGPDIAGAPRVTLEDRLQRAEALLAVAVEKGLVRQADIDAKVIEQAKTEEGQP